MAAVLTLLVVLTLHMLGYRFDPATRTVEQTGLVQYDSQPRGATVLVDDQEIGTTHTKSAVRPGQRQFSIRLAGYDEWRKVVEITPGTLTWLSYARLVPTERRVETAAQLPALMHARFSPRGRFLAGVGAAADSGRPFWVLTDVRDATAVTSQTVAIDTGQLTDAAAGGRYTLSIVEWSQDGKKVLIKAVRQPAEGAAVTDWLLLNREKPEEMVNVSQLVKLPIRTMQLAKNGAEAYVLLESGDVRRVTVATGDMSRPLLSRVTKVLLYGDDVLAYVGHEQGAQVAGVLRTDWERPRVLMTVPDQAASVQMALSYYLHEYVMAVSVGAQVTHFRGALPGSDEALTALRQGKQTFALTRPVRSLQFSGHGRFLVAEDAERFVSYDMERQSLSQETIKERSTPKLSWLDDYYVWHVNSEGQVVMQEFDGTNKHVLLPGDAAYDVAVSDDAAYLYAMQVYDGGVRLQRLAMTADT